MNSTRPKNKQKIRLDHLSLALLLQALPLLPGFSVAVGAESAQQQSPTQAWTFAVDKEHTSIEFEVSHLMLSSVKGRFDDFEGVAELDVKTFALRSFSGTVIAKSINTNQEMRDKHLRSADFFDVEKFPQLRLEASGLNVAKGSKTTVKAKITIRDVTQDIPIDFNYRGIVKDPFGAERAVVEASMHLSRKAFGLTWNKILETGGALVGDEIKISLTIQAKQKQ